MNFTVPVVALIAGAAIGFCLSPEGSKPCPECVANAEKAEKAKAVRPERARRQADSENRALRRRVRELENEKTAAAADRKVEAEEAARRGPAPQGADWLANVKNEDPERYQQITNNMARWRAQRQSAVRTRLDFLSSIDSSKLPRHARDTHEKLMNLYQERETIQSRLDAMLSGNPSEQLSEDDRRKLFEEMRETTGAINELAAQERENLLKMTASELGFKGEDVGEITATIKGIIDATSTTFNMPRPPRMGGRHGAGGPR